MKLVKKISCLVDHIKRLEGDKERAEYKEASEKQLKEIISNAPSGSGIDNGTGFDIDRSNPERLVFYADYHHMNDGGYYDGWTNHEIIVTPSLQFGFNLRITGKNRNNIKDYLYDVYQCWLSQEIPE